MRIQATATLTSEDIGALTEPLRRFERMRSLPALVIVGAMALLALLAMPPFPAATGVVAFLGVAALALSWQRTAQRATTTAQVTRAPTRSPSPVRASPRVGPTPAPN
ncbi:hypothetical protein GXW82_10330 [Streptacidiphilus sp. 4-A2]|nr:hypothetical protein [Streptacidiphilus sp. 4-A2]